MPEPCQGSGTLFKVVAIPHLLVCLGMARPRLALCHFCTSLAATALHIASFASCSPDTSFPMNSLYPGAHGPAVSRVAEQHVLHVCHTKHPVQKHYITLLLS